MKKWIAVVLILCFALSMSACELDYLSSVSMEETTAAADETTVTSTVETPSASSYETTEANTTGFSMNDLKITLNGKEIKLPCTLDDLGEEYSFGVSTKPIGEDYIMTELLFKNELFCVSHLFDCKEVKQANRNSLIYTMLIDKYTFKKQKVPIFDINSINFNSSKQDIINVFGDNQNDDVDSNNNIKYYDSNNAKQWLGFILSEEDKIELIYILYEIGNI